MQLLNQRLAPVDRALLLSKYAQHIAYIAGERQVYAQHAKMARFDRESIPGQIIIRGPLSLHIDKMTGETTKIPALFPPPKCMNSADRLPVVITGVVVHGIGYFTFKSYASSSGGCNLTMEVLYRLFQHLQSLGYRFSGVTRIQADNHTDNKTPAVLFFLGVLVLQGAFLEVILSFLKLGHGHIYADQKNSSNSRAIHRRSSIVISESRLDMALMGAFVKAANKPIIIAVNYVRDWVAFLAPVMARINLERLACSQGSGDAQMVYRLQRQPTGGVGLTYKASMQGFELYPRRLNPGSVYTSGAHGTGSVTASAFDPNEGAWHSTVMYHTGISEVVVHPPEPIELFPEPAFIPTGVPPIEPMQPTYPDVLARAKRNIARCTAALDVFHNEAVAPGVTQEWAAFFTQEDALVARCTATPGTPLYVGPDQYTALLPCIAPTGPAEVPRAAPLPPPVFEIDPVVHAAFTSAQRTALQHAARQPALAAASLVLLRLPFRAQMPPEHILPVCVGRLPADFDAGAIVDGGAVSFHIYHSTARVLTGTWKESGAAGQTTLGLPLRAILMSGIELTQGGKLSAASLRKITDSVLPFELLPMAP
jgi:hypothetical protein